MSSTPFPVFLHLLADRQLAVGAALLVFEAGAVEGVAQLGAESDFATFASKLPCRMLADQWAGLPAELQSSLSAVGCTAVATGAVWRCDALTKPVPPAAALWLDGHWMLAPPLHPSAGQSASRTLALKLLQLVMADAETRDIEAVLRQDPALSYHLLRLVNSLGMGMTRRITSFAQAIMMLGRMQLRRWLNLMLFAARADDYRAPMLLARVVVRARSMELLAKEVGLDRADQDMAFMAGMFSMLDVLFGTPLPELIKPLQLSDELQGAIIGHEGDIGRLLQMQVCAGHCDAPGVATLLAGLHLNAAQFTQASLAACHWMLDITRETQGVTHD